MLQACWERERTQKSSFGWTGDAAAKDLEVHEKEFCPTVIRTIIPVWLLETLVVDLKLLQMNARNKNADLVIELYGYEEQTVQVFTDGSKDPITGNTESAVAVDTELRYAYKCIFELCTIVMALEWFEQNTPNNVL